MKKLLFTFIASALLAGTAQAASLLDDFPTVELVVPTDSQTYDIGDTIEMQALVENATRPVYAYLIEVSRNQRIWIDRVPLAEGKSYYDLRFTIPQDFFSKNRLSKANTQFRIGLSTRAGHTFARALSRKRITINPPADLTISPSEDDETNQEQETANETLEPQTDAEPAEPVSLESRNIIGGLHTVASYEFSALHEPWIVRRLTVVNDSQEDGFEYDKDEDTALVRRVIVSYTNSNGVKEEKSASFAAGRAILSGLDFFIPRNGRATINIKADVVDPRNLGSEYAGKSFKLGIQDTNNSGVSFEAVGAVSSNLISDFGGASISSGQVQEFVVNENIMTFEHIGPPSSTLIAGENTVYEFTISANAGSVSLARLVFDISQSGLSSVDQASFWRGSTKLQAGNQVDAGSVYLRWDAGGSACFAQDAQSSGAGMNCAGGTAQTGKLIVTFNNEEIIPGGASQTYRLKLNATGVNQGDSLAANIATGDESSKLAVGGSVGTRGHIYNNGNGNELFVNAPDFISDVDSYSNRNVVWSDRSDPLHRYHSVTPGINPTVDAGSSEDWTNGYLLKIINLPRRVLSR